MSEKYKIAGNGSLITEGSASGKSVGPIGTQGTYVSSSKFGVIGVSDSANTDYAKKQEIKELLKKYRDIISRGRFLGKDVAADMLEHWLGGSGSDKKLDCEWLRDFDSITDAEDENKKRFEKKTIAGVISKIKEGQALEKKDYWDKKLTASVFGELYYASGTSVITSRGLFKFKQNKGWITISGTVEHHWWDPYDWHLGLAAYIPGFGSVKDADAKKLENAGYAHKFNMYSMWHQHFSGKHGVDKGFVYFDDSNYKWGKVKCGRAPVGATGRWAASDDAVTDSFRRPLPGLATEKSPPNSPTTLKVPTARRERRRRERKGWR